jgi:hypothetical protein
MVKHCKRDNQLIIMAFNRKAYIKDDDTASPYGDPIATAWTQALPHLRTTDLATRKDKVSADSFCHRANHFGWGLRLSSYLWSHNDPPTGGVP